MKQPKSIIEALSVFVILVALVVMVGWFLDIGILKSLYPGWVSMKFTTALSFILCGLITLSIYYYLKNGSDSFQILLSMLSLLVLLLMLTLFISNWFNIPSGIENLFIRELPSTVNTPVPGRPSVMSMLNFVLVSSLGFITLFNPKKLAYWFIGIGSSALLIGLSPLLGYLSDTPFLYYSIPGFSSAMAFHTAFLFVLLGVQTILLGEFLPHSPLRKK